MIRAFQIIRTIPGADLAFAVIAALTLWFTAAALAAVLP